MNIVILGASGRTGKLLVNQALARGHTVTAVVRNPAKMLPANKLTVVKADVLSEQDLTEAFKGKDAVLSTLGSNKDVHLIERSSEAIIPAMEQNGIERFVTELSFGAATTVRFSRLVTIGFRTVLKEMLIDQAAGLQLLRASQLDWTAVLPTVLTNGPSTQQVRALKEGEKVGMRHKISRNDVAYFMLETLESELFHREEVVITRGA
jgi:putative NADH-flavin reductase